MHTLRLYFSLTKPGVLLGNVISSIAGFLFASKLNFNTDLFFGLLIGITLIIASACALNNYYDRDIDKVMERTKNRPSANGRVKGQNVVIFSIILLIFGTLILFTFTNILTTAIALLGFFIYVWPYAMFSKRKSYHGTLVGAIAGAMPILAGYTSVTNFIDIGAVLLFASLFFWQLPEFYSISIYRHDEYKKAKIPVISVVKGIKATKIQILIFTIAFVISTLLLTSTGYTGYIYFFIMLLLGTYWIYLATKLVRETSDDKNSRKMFKFSLIILLIFCFMISITGVVKLP